jgi:predicted homoserine dehydrogenase-like protein
LGQVADAVGQPIVDYVLPKGYSAGGVFVVGRHDEEQTQAIEYFKLGGGPYYTLLRPFHLCSLEVGKTLRRVINGGGVLLNNSTAPTLGVAAIAKVALKAGETIARGIGGYQVRGEVLLLSSNPEHVPIGMLNNAVLRRAVEPGQVITFDDVEIPQSRALEIVLQQRQYPGVIVPQACGLQTGCPR